MIHEHDHAILTADLPDEGFQAGDVGIVVHIYDDHQAYEIEFLALKGRTIDVVTVEAHQVRAVSNRDMLHARTITASA